MKLAIINSSELVWLARQGIDVPCAVRFGAGLFLRQIFNIMQTNISGPSVPSAIDFLQFFELKKLF